MQRREYNDCQKRGYADLQQYCEVSIEVKEQTNDRTFTGHIIVADLCRDTANLLEELEQEPILDNIRAKIEQIADEEQKHDKKWAIGLRYALKIIDKYRQGAW